ncbi:crotonase/enoyl-CoA hydratase family protein [Polymorphum gilvum]|uniref:Enoyl-CoA hydratase/isomerase family protein n=1 Tax=Polymorphum gilvum (strain LMG 25793 / CGMCC 1.9160 / SL003B-26A1) TaxID=991905 RepID=F2IYA2_POLGS|nr:crotonase/enoyl-CoA hydratase family protein [Polymorphum gilvum]ADZ71714.1 Enoyl-CoA hydratase/isomerase family protein [Polymorphum gilvum SL003B-26A1]
MIRRQIADGVNLLRFDRPDKKNAITGEMYLALAQALTEGDADAQVRCHLLCGTPGAFTAGNDIADFLHYAGTGALSEQPVSRFLEALSTVAKPMVAAVDGLAIGVGTTLLLHCDMVFASPRSLFRSPFVDLGLVPEAGSSLLAPRVMGYQRAFELLCLGDGFDAEAARAAGFVNHVVAEAEVEARALDCARRIAAKPVEAMRLARGLLRADWDQVLRRLAEESALFSERLGSPEARAAFTAFMTKGKA